MKRILFVGNSYTFVNDLPGMVAAKARDAGLELEVQSVTHGGYSFAHFLSEDNPYGIKLRECLTEKYDIAVLQEQSLRAALHPDSYVKDAVTLCNAVRAAGTVPLLYFTWPRREGSEGLEKHGFCSARDMQNRLHSGFMLAAQDTGAAYADAGTEFCRILEKESDAELYAPDGSHPSVRGTEIAADCVLRAIQTLL